MIARAGQSAAIRFLEFFTVNIRNPNTCDAYGRAAGAFLRWCETRRGLVELRQIRPVHVASYIEELQGEFAAPRQTAGTSRSLNAWSAIPTPKPGVPHGLQREAVDRGSQRSSIMGLRDIDR